MQVGDLVKFRFIYNGCSLNNQKALYVGKAYIHRDDGVVVRNHEILVIGASKPRIIDEGLLKYMEAICK
jgi:hypothetical protein